VTDPAARDEAVPLTEEELERLSHDEDPGDAYGWLKWATGAVAFALSCYALYWTQFSVNTTVYRASFLAISLAVVILRHPLLRGRSMDPRRPTIEECATSLLAVALIGFAIHESKLFDKSVFAGGVAVIFAACFALYPVSVMNRFLGRIRPMDWIFVGLVLWTAVYLSLNIEAYKTRPTRPTPDEIVLGTVLIVLVLEGARRAVGWILPAIAVLFLAYCYLGPIIPEPFDHRGFSLNRIIGQNFLTLEGIFSTPVEVAVTFIILFSIYGAVLARGGAGQFFIDWAFALFGKQPSPSAPGRSVVASGFLLGTVSGSGVATTVTLASLAWPMLKRSGYPPNVAGGMLSAAGIGATLSPPTLGAVAFIIAEYLDVDYLQILIYASIPTLLYYLSCWLMTEADARRLNVQAVKTSDASLWQLTMRYGYHFLSLAAIAVFLILGFSAFMAVFWSIAIAFLLSMVRPENRLVSPRAFGAGVAAGAVSYVYGVSGLAAAHGLGELFDGRLSVTAFWIMAAAIVYAGIEAFRSLRGGQQPAEQSTRMIEALTEGALSTLGILATCACAGIIVSVVNLTGLGLTISSIIVNVGGGERLAVILLAAIAMWVLGTAVPVTASYIIAAVMLVPALTSVGIPDPAAHMFMFYYAVLADVSPPTALAPFAASAITGGKPFRTMLQAWKYTLPAFLVPVMFCLTADGLRLLALTPDGGAPSTATDWLEILIVTSTSCLALVGLCIGLTGYARTAANLLERVLCTVGGALLLAADIYADLGGAALLALGLALHWMRTQRTATLPQ
jgi:TRAP transporter 4TM/12TM fusion protein